MMMENKKEKLNNHGLSLVELLVVVAIMAIVVGGVVTGISLFTNTYAKQAARGIEDFISTARTKATSIAADEWNVEISYDGKSGDFTYTLNKVTITKDDKGTEKRSYEVIEKQVYEGDLEMFFINGDDKDAAKVALNSEKNTLRLVFSQTQGSISDMRISGYTLKHTIGQEPSDIIYFIINRGSYTKKIAVYTLTGKYEVIE